MKTLKWAMCFVVSATLTIVLVSCGGPRALRAPSGYRCAGMAFSPDGSALAMAYDAHESPHRGMVLELRAWPSLKRRWRVEVEEEYGSIMSPVAFSPGGDELALLTRYRLWRYSIEGELLTDIPFQEDPRIAGEGLPLTVRYVPDGSLAVLIDRDGSLFLVRYDREGNPSGDAIPVGDESWISWSRPFSADGRFLAYVEEFHVVGLVDLTTGEVKEWDLREKLRVKPSGDWLRAVWGVAVHPRGTEIALGLRADQPGLPQVMRLDAASGEVIEEFLPAEGEDAFICALTYSRDGSLLAAMACSSPFKGTLVLRSLATGGLEPVCDSEKDESCLSRYISFSPQARFLALLRGNRVVFVKVPEQE